MDASAHKWMWWRGNILVTEATMLLLCSIMGVTTVSTSFLTREVEQSCDSSFGSSGSSSTGGNRSSLDTLHLSHDLAAFFTVPQVFGDSASRPCSEMLAAPSCSTTAAAVLESSSIALTVCAFIAGIVTAVLGVVYSMFGSASRADAVASRLLGATAALATPARRAARFAFISCVCIMLLVTESSGLCAVSVADAAACAGQSTNCPATGQQNCLYYVAHCAPTGSDSQDTEETGAAASASGESAAAAEHPTSARCLDPQYAARFPDTVDIRRVSNSECVRCGLLRQTLGSPLAAPRLTSPSMPLILRDFTAARVAEFEGLGAAHFDASLMGNSITESTRSALFPVHCAQNDVCWTSDAAEAAVCGCGDDIPIAPPAITSPSQRSAAGCQRDLQLTAGSASAGDLVEDIGRVLQAYVSVVEGRSAESVARAAGGAGGVRGAANLFGVPPQCIHTDDLGAASGKSFVSLLSPCRNDSLRDGIVSVACASASTGMRGAGETFPQLHPQSASCSNTSRIYRLNMILGSFALLCELVIVAMEGALKKMMPAEAEVALK